MIGVGSVDWVRHPLPPNRTCGSPASGSPVDGLPASGLAGKDMGLAQVEKPVFGKERIAAFHPLFEGRQHPRCPNPRFDPRPFLVRPRGLMDLSVSCSPGGHCDRSASIGFGHSVSIFLHPFAPPALPGFFATTSALTPARGRGLAASSALLPTRRSPCFTLTDLPSPLPPTTDPLRWSLCHLPSAPLASPARAGVWASPLDRRLARRYGRIEFLIVRMAGSPSVAPHPASWRRRYSRLQACVGMPGEDLHLPDQLRSQAHGPGLRRDDE